MASSTGYAPDHSRRYGDWRDSRLAGDQSTDTVVYCYPRHILGVQGNSPPLQRWQLYISGICPASQGIYISRHRIPDSQHFEPHHHQCCRGGAGSDNDVANAVWHLDEERRIERGRCTDGGSERVTAEGRRVRDLGPPCCPYRDNVRHLAGFDLSIER